MTDEGPELFQGEEPPSPAPVHIETLIEQYAVARELYELLRDELNGPGGPHDRYRATEAALFDAIESMGLRSVRHRTLGAFRLSDIADAKLADRDAFLIWAKENMPEILLPNYQRLGKLTRDALRGEPAFAGSSELPPGLEFTTRRNVTWTRGQRASNDGEQR